jgi:hypothetical protein
MANIRPIDGEQTILASGVLTVTSHRIRLHSAGGGQAHVVGMLLESVTGCELTHVAHRGLLVLAALGLLSGVGLNHMDGALVVGIGLALVSVVAYFLTRRQVVRVSSPSTQMDVEVKRASFDEAIGIVEAIEHAKHAWHVQHRR